MTTASNVAQWRRILKDIPISFSPNIWETIIKWPELLIGRNSENIQGSAADLTVSVERAANTLVYTDGTQGWLLTAK